MTKSRTHSTDLGSFSSNDCSNVTMMQPYPGQHPSAHDHEPHSSQKPKKKGETYITSAFNVLPPCTVCGEKSSGMHYGVNTCEGCKGFFRRCTQKSTPDFQCIFGDGKCVVQGASRNKCQYCRYRKCLQVGMSKGAIKIGRYTKELKIKNLETAQQVQALSMEPVVKHPVLCQATSDDVICLAHSLRTLHGQTNEYREERIPELMQRQREFLELRSRYQPEQPDGDTNMVEHVAQKLLKPGIQMAMQFAKGIPQFSELNDEDQVTLLKPAIAEMWFICATRTFNFEYGCYTLPDGTTVDRLTFPQSNLVDCLLDVAAKVRALQLTDDEISIIRAILLFSPDRPGLKEPHKIRLIQGQLMEALKWVMSTSSRRSHHTAGAAMMAISDLRNALVQYGSWLLGLKVGNDLDSFATSAEQPKTRRRASESDIDSSPAAHKHPRFSGAEFPSYIPTTSHSHTLAAALLSSNFLPAAAAATPQLPRRSSTNGLPQNNGRTSFSPKISENLHLPSPVRDHSPTSRNGASNSS